jgi:hypothetical protein
MKRMAAPSTDPNLPCHGSDRVRRQPRSEPYGSGRDTHADAYANVLRALGSLSASSTGLARYCIFSAHEATLSIGLRRVACGAATGPAARAVLVPLSVDAQVRAGRKVPHA